MKINKYLLSFSTSNFIKFQKRLLFSAKITNNFKGFFTLSPNEIDDGYFKHYDATFWQKSRGYGYWLWKPYFLLKYVKKIDFNDYLVYIDTGVVILRNINILIKSMEKNQQDIMSFYLPVVEKQWTKKDLFLRLNLNQEKYYDSNQVLASFFIIKKTTLTIKFLEEFLSVCENTSNIDDNSILKNDDFFIEHRHDQSVFSLLIKKYNFLPFRDPSQFGFLPNLYKGIIKSTSSEDKTSRIIKQVDFSNSNYPLVFLHTRKNSFLRTILSLIKRSLINFKF
jgi:hypothetical protein